MRERLVNSINALSQKRPELFGVKGIERRGQTPFDIPVTAPLTVRPFDERGPKPNRFTDKIPPTVLWIASHVPKAGTLVDIARLADVGYSVVQGAVDGDVLRMPDAAKDLDREQKIEYVIEYMKNRFDRANRIAKKEYHKKKGLRAIRRALGNSVAAGLSFAVLGTGIVGSTLGASYGIDAGVEVLLASREYSEARHISKRSGKMKNGEYQESPAFKTQLAKAVEIIGITDDTRERDLITNYLAGRLDSERRIKWHAFERLERENPNATKEIKRTARKLERLDYIIDHYTRPLAIVSRLVRDKKSLEELKVERARIRREEVYAYDPRQFRYVKGYQG